MVKSTDGTQELNSQKTTSFEKPHATEYQKTVNTSKSANLMISNRTNEVVMIFKLENKEPHILFLHIKKPKGTGSSIDCLRRNDVVLALSNSILTATCLTISYASSRYNLTQLIKKMFALDEDIYVWNKIDKKGTQLPGDHNFDIRTKPWYHAD